MMQKLASILTLGVTVAVATTAAEPAPLPLKTPETSRHFRQYVDPQTGISSYRLDTRIAENQQSIYFTQKSMTDDGRFLIFDISGGERRNRKTLALFDFLTDELYPLDISAGIPFLDVKTDRLYYVNRNGIFRRDLLDDPKKEIKLCPIPKELTSEGKRIYNYCTHLTLTADRKKAFLDSRVDDKFVQGMVDLETGGYEKWGETDFFVNHGQIHPSDDKLALCAWEVSWKDSRGKEHQIEEIDGVYPRLWLFEPGGKRRMIPSEETNYATHEHWTEDGKGFYFCSDGIFYHDLATGRQTCMAKVKAAHATMSADNRYLTFDAPVGTWFRGCAWQVGFFNRATGKAIYLYPSLPAYNTEENPSKLHPDPHPQFVCGDRYIICTVNHGDGRMDLSVTPVEQLIEKTK